MAEHLKQILPTTGAARDYSTVTELPGSRVTAEQLARVGHRYAIAARYCEAKDVLEAGCGPGLGLGYLARRARRIVGGDYTEALSRSARQHYGGRVPVLRFDAQALPFKDRTFDVVILLEVIYYLEHPSDFLTECQRVLRPGGIVVIGTANRSWPGFAPSPFSVCYYAVPELAALLRKHDFDPQVFGCVPARAPSLAGRVVSMLRRAAVSLHLIPKTMKGKELLKRIFYGTLSPLPPEIDARNYADAYPLVALPPEAPSRDYKVLYAVGRMR